MYYFLKFTNYIIKVNLYGKNYTIHGICIAIN